MRRSDRDWAGALAESASIVHVGTQAHTVAALIASGRNLWRAHRSARFPALRGIADADMLSLLLAALVDRRSALLCAADATPPALCDAVVAPPFEACAADAEGFAATTRDGTVPDGCPAGLAVLSSGTLGTPKVIWHAHADLLATAALTMRRLDLRAGDRVLITVPLHHMYGLGAALLPALLAGARVGLLPKANLIVFNAALRAHSPTWVYSTPHLLRTLVQRKETPVEGCRGVVMAGDRIPAPLHAHAKRIFRRVFDLYGSSELGVIAISAANDPAALHPLDGVRASPATPAAEHGALIVAHPHAATHIAHGGAPRALPETWDTGDIADFRDDGGFAIRGRADLSVNRSGRLLILAELERAVMEWPDVELAVAFALEEDASAGKAVAVVVQPSSPAMTVEALKRYAAEKLPAFARPDRYVIAKEIPRLGSGKPNRKAITQEHLHE